MKLTNCGRGLAFILATTGERQWWPVREAEKELQQGRPALSPAPRGSAVPGRHPPEPGRFQQRPLSSSNSRSVPSRLCAPGGQLDHFAATPSRDLTSQSSFSLTPGLLSGAGELFQGEVPRGREAAAQQLGGDISAHQTQSWNWGEGRLGFGDP